MTPNITVISLVKKNAILAIKHLRAFRGCELYKYRKCRKESAGKAVSMERETELMIQVEESLSGLGKSEF